LAMRCKSSSSNSLVCDGVCLFGSHQRGAGSSVIRPVQGSRDSVAVSDDPSATAGVMAVLAEAISLIVRIDAIGVRLRGGPEAFPDLVPNETLACDGEIARVGFMAPVDVGGFIARLEALGLVFLRDGEAQDMAVADQQFGLTSRCAWLGFGRVSLGGNVVSACQMRGSTSQQIFTPEGWVFEGSLSQTFTFVPNGRVEKSIDYEGRENGLDLFRSRLTGKRGFTGRTERGVIE
jgi:hypothetical protein